ncbi:MAG: B12-binding domain-containing radical SAM protein [Planctomycetaceae bacterium]|nr:B12-binding domain-containing radical SAM protein [Planctomycetaceae bacterium]
MSERRVMLVKLDKPPGGPSHLSYSEPIGICYIAAFLEQHGLDCRLTHLFQHDADQALCREIADYAPDVIGFSVRNFNLAATQRAIATIRKSFPAIRIIAGGECITAQQWQSVAALLDTDALIIGDGESSLLAYGSGVSPDEIPGCAYRDQDGIWHGARHDSGRIALAELPMMSRHGLPMNRYCSEAFPGKTYATMHTMRGCRYHCTFCHTAGRYAKVDTRTTSQILDEVALLVREHSVEAIGMWDEDFFAYPKRVEQIAQGLVDRGSPVEWQSFMKLTDLQKAPIRQLLPLLRRSGYVRAIIGLESFLPATLRGYHKAGGTNVEELCRHLTDHGITLCPAYIIGAPHETAADVAYGLERLGRLGVDHGIRMDLPFVQFITPYPGTALFSEYLEQDLIFDPDWSHYDGEHVVVKSKCPADQLLGLRDAFYANFYGQSSESHDATTPSARLCG